MIAREILKKVYMDGVIKGAESTANPNYKNIDQALRELKKDWVRAIGIVVLIGLCAWLFGWLILKGVNTYLERPKFEKYEQKVKINLEHTLAFCGIGYDEIMSVSRD